MEIGILQCSKCLDTLCIIRDINVIRSHGICRQGNLVDLANSVIGEVDGDDKRAWNRNGNGGDVRQLTPAYCRRRRRRRCHITFDRVDKSIVCTHMNWIYGNVFNVLCIFAYYLWSSIFETSVICDVVVASSCAFFVFPLFCVFHSFWLANIRNFVRRFIFYPCAHSHSHSCNVFIIKIRIFIWFIAQEPIQNCWIDDFSNRI